MTTIASPAELQAQYETNTTYSDEIAAAVMERALPLSCFGENLEGYHELYHKMGIKPIVQHRYIMNGEVFYIQDDTVQESGAFKSRGAANAVLHSDAREVFGATAGNHGSGLAQACQKLGKRAFISAPAGAAEVKIARMERFGATVDATFDNVDAAVPTSQSTAEQRGGLFVHPYDNVDVIAGQATAGFDMLQNLLREHTLRQMNLFEDDVEVFVPIGGGGLITGVASVFRWAKDAGYIGENVRVVGVQMENCDAMRRAVAAIHEGSPPTNLFKQGELNARCDGTAVAKVGAFTLPVVADKRYVDRIELVKEQELGLGMYDLRAKLGKRIEPAGALAHAAALHSLQPGYRVPVCSGRNVTNETWDYFVGSYEPATTELPERKLSVWGGAVLRQSVGSPQQSSSLHTNAAAHREVMDDYYDSLEESGIFMQRRY
jgi:threonine dehydratase